MDKIRRGSDLRKEKWGSPSIQESKIAAMFSKRSSIHTVTNCVTFPRRPGSTTIPWCHMLLRSILLENVCASMPCLLPSWSAMHDECVTCAKKCAVAMGANVLKLCWTGWVTKSKWPSQRLPILKSISSLLHRIPLKHSKKSKILFAICLNLLLYYGHLYL